MAKTSLSDFERLNDLIYLYRSPATSASRTEPASAATAPDLIVFCSWVGAASKHIAKYIDTYRKILPRTNILLIRSNVRIMFASCDLSPAVDVMQAFMAGQAGSDSANSAQGSIVLHLFSHGGATQALRLVKKLRESSDPIPLNSIILDSCPGRAEVGATARAISLSIPNNRLLRILGFYLVYCLVFFLMLVDRISQREGRITRLRRLLNDSEVFTASAPRLYLFSKADSMVKYSDVHDHAEDARKAGLQVTEEVFERAPHCALLNEDAVRYWKSVQEHINQGRS